MSNADRKAAKEAFVAGLTGSSKVEIFALVSILSTSIVICEYLKRRRPRREWFALELLVIIYPHLLLCTGAIPIHPAFPLYLTLAAACLALVVFRWRSPFRARFETDPPAGLPPEETARKDVSLDDLAGRRKSFVSVFRGALMAATCICILAVDFHAFPRRYAKTELYGTGYMDVGVGGVVFTAGLVSAGRTSPGSGGGGGGTGEQRRRPNLLRHRVWGAVRGAAACWVLGLVRLFTTRAVNYQAHVGEYGVHWNFYNTIAVVALLGQAVAIPPEGLLPAAVAVTAGHQVALSVGGLGPWVMSPHRATDLISLNKEGLVSCVGFWALYLWGAALAHIMHRTLQPAVAHLRARGHGDVADYPRSQGGANSKSPRDEGDDDDGGPAAGVASLVTSLEGRATGGGLRSPGISTWAAVAPLVRWWVQMAVLDAALWLAVAALEARVEPVSRRSCNAAYVLWIAAQFLQGMLPLALCQALETAVAVRSGGGGAPAITTTTIAIGSADTASPEETNAGAISPDGRQGSTRNTRTSKETSARTPADSCSPAVAAKTPKTVNVTDPERKPSGTCEPSGGGRGSITGESQAQPDGGRGAGWGPRVLLAINRNQLAVFLLANLMTGTVNMTLDTLAVSDWAARALLAVYITCVCVLAVFLDSRGLRLKL